MARQIKLDDREKIEIVDSDGIVTGYFRFNPTDTGIISRFNDLEKYFQDKEKELSGLSSKEFGIDEMESLISDIKKQYDKLLDYDGAGEALFKNASPLSLRPNGEIFAIYVMNQILKFIKTEFGIREERAKSRISKYTAKYKK